MILLYILLGSIIAIPLIIYGATAYFKVSVGAAVMTNMELTGWVYILIIFGLLSLITMGLLVNFMFVTIRNVRGPQGPPGPPGTLTPSTKRKITGLIKDQLLEENQDLRNEIINEILSTESNPIKDTIQKLIRETVASI